MNVDFGKIKNEQLEYAPSSLKIGNIFYSAPSETQYFQAGYKKIVDVRPEEKENFIICFDKYTEDDQHIYYNYKYEAIQTEEPQDETFQISKLYFRIALTKLGLWDKVVGWMKSTRIMISEDQWLNMYEAYNDALVLDTGSELFQPYLDMAKDTFKDLISSEEIDQLLLSCKAK